MSAMASLNDGSLADKIMVSAGPLGTVDTQDVMAPFRRPDEALTLDPERLEKDLAKLVLTLVELLRRLMESQAVHRMERGTLSDDEVERLGAALLAARDKIAELREAFGLAPEDLNLDLGPLGSLL